MRFLMNMMKQISIQIQKVKKLILNNKEEVNQVKGNVLNVNNLD